MEAMAERNNRRKSILWPIVSCVDFIAALWIISLEMIAATAILRLKVSNRWRAGAAQVPLLTGEGFSISI